MEKINVQWDWPPVPGMEKYLETYTIEFILNRYKQKYRRAKFVIAVCDTRP